MCLPRSDLAAAAYASTSPHERRKTVRKLLLSVAMLAALLLGSVGIATAASPGTQGQPGQSCQNPATSTTPGNASGAPGSPFNANGTSGGVYANGPGSTPNGGVTNPTAVSQYDVACFQNSQPHH
jgi:hypothetical protein